MKESWDEVSRRALFEGFRFGLRVCGHVHHPETTGAEQSKLWDLMREIAEGRETIRNSPGELPNARQLSEKRLERMHGAWNEMIARDRDRALAILQEFAASNARLSRGAQDSE